ncbi:hypothetical protein AB0K12_32805 [Nonomuraea sp. NPDC049419]|uniref:hypothetical protein n=1 Tax=Nonomuraea sp. NPDC049419 TaxID=3155772 RepID=UPI0034479AC0
MRKRGILFTTLTVALATPVVALSAPVAQATATTQQAAVCELHIGRTTKSGNTIIGYGSQSQDCGTGGTSQLVIQRHRWSGWTDDLATATVVGRGHDVYVRYNCSGTGTHTYRTIHRGRTVGGSPEFKESNHLRVSC